MYFRVNNYIYINRIAAYAKKHIEIARTNTKLPKNANIAFLSAAEAYEWLMELEEYNFDIFEPKLQKLSSSKMSKKMIECAKNGQF